MNEDTGDDRVFTGFPTDNELLQQLQELYLERGMKGAWHAEGPSWAPIIGALRNHEDGIGFNYEIESALGLGGAAVVFRVVDKNLFARMNGEDLRNDDQRLLRSYRALKVPRPHNEKGQVLAASLRDEVFRLGALSHPNIIPLYAKGHIPVELRAALSEWPWFVMGYVEQATDLATLSSEKPPDLPILVRHLREVALGMQYVHENGIVHCDIKPGNMLVPRHADASGGRTAVLADFGYAKYMWDREGATTVGFTEYFAHPDLLYGSKGGTQASRTFSRITRDQIRAAFDLYAFGMSIHWLLEQAFYKSFDVHKRYAYELKFLRLSAARLLDGLNHHRGITYGGLPFECFGDRGEEGSPAFDPGLKYRSARELVLDFNKLLGEANPEVAIPELTHTHRENIQVSDVAPVIYTDRLRKVVDHPLVRRLGAVAQLGLVNLVYPGASHSRLEHALGTMGMTAKYISSLYRDTLQPIFAQLVDIETMKATLLAALLHDLGHYPLAHDLEDVSVRFFGHESVRNELLTAHPRAEDQQFSLFRDEPRIEELAEDLSATVAEQWAVPMDAVAGILLARSADTPRPRQAGTYTQRLCKSIIDGPIDSDKVDYLQRDARHCNVQYGYGIDTVRLLRCLTVAYQAITSDQLLMVIGVHEKGRISAESILFTRYAMLTQVYWHHTMRSIKALVHHAAADALAAIASGPGEWGGRRRDFLECAILGREVEDGDWRAVVNRSSAIPSIHAGDLRVLGWLWKNGTQSGRAAVAHILDRTLFKRLLTVYRGELTDSQRRTLTRVFTPESFRERLRLRDSIQRAICDSLRTIDIPTQLLETEGFTAELWKQRMADKNALRCLVDFPTPRPGAAFGLHVVRQWGERPGQRGPDPIGPSTEIPMIIPVDNFKDGMRELEKSIATLRVFWHPDEDGIVREALGEGRIRDIVVAELAKFVPEDESD